MPNTDEAASITKGAKKFRAFILGKNLTGRAVPIKIVAAAIQVTERTIDRWLDGTYSPDPGSRCVIESWTGGEVLIEMWQTHEEKRRIEYANRLKPYGEEDGPQTRPNRKRTR